MASNIFDPALKVTTLRGGRQVQSVFAREVEMLQSQGYRFQQGAGMATGHGFMVR